jgi:hypothetical protein
MPPAGTSKITVNHCFTPIRLIISVAKGLKFWPQNTKGAEKNCVGLGIFGAKFFADLSKRAEKGPNFLGA